MSLVIFYCLYDGFWMLVSFMQMRMVVVVVVAVINEEIPLTM